MRLIMSAKPNFEPVNFPLVKSRVPFKILQYLRFTLLKTSALLECSGYYNEPTRRRKIPQAGCIRVKTI